MVKLLFKGGGIGKQYTGMDGEHCLIAHAGQAVDVSEGKALQLLGDFPGCWEEVKPEPESPPAAEPDAQEQKEVEDKPEPETAQTQKKKNKIQFWKK